MINSIEDIFEIRMESNATASYLVLTPKAELDTINYQVQMLLNNHIRGMLKFYLKSSNMKNEFFYDLTSMITLEQFLKRKTFNRNEFIYFLLDILNSIYDLKRYLLFESNIVLEESKIYIDLEEMRLYFIYIPCNSINNDFKLFLFNLIIKLSKFNDETSDNYIQKILEIIKSDTFSLYSLKSLLERLIKEESEAKVKDTYNIDLKQPDYKDTCKAINIKVPEIKIPNLKVPQKKVSTNKNNTQKHNPKNKNTLLLIQPLILVAYLIFITSDYIKISSYRYMESFIAAIILGATDFVLFKILLNPVGIPNIIKNKKKNVDKIESIEVTDILKGTQKQGYSGETEILIRTKHTEPRLKEQNGSDEIVLNKNNVLLGRMDGFVDHAIKSNSIGKVHAEISQNNGLFYISDCNSKNGTFINEQRILPNSKTEIIAGDIIRFANIEYIFML